MNLTARIGVFTVIALGTAFAAAAELSDAEWAAMKREKFERQRGVLYNNDGADATALFPADQESTPENFLNIRLRYAKGSKVDAVLYCAGNPGGFLSSRSKIAEYKTTQPRNKKNVVGDFFRMGTDPVRIVQEFCRENNLEFFISLRGNDTHDYQYRPSNNWPQFSQFKKDNLDLLVGRWDNRPKHGYWSAMDFTRKAVRDRFVAVAVELMTDYEVDGLEIDFARHMVYFKSVAFGGTASDGECEMLTDAMRQVRAAAEKVGRARQRPILIAVRTADCPAYSKAVGLDFEQWMKEKLIDIHIGGFYFQLRPWEDSVKLAHRYGVKFYPSFDESRITKADMDYYRNGAPTFWARAAGALTAGADGIYYFNRDYPPSFIRHLRGKMADIRFEDKRYFITYVDHFRDYYLHHGDRFYQLKHLSPNYPAVLLPGRPASYVLEFGEDFSPAALQGRTPELIASLRTEVDPAALRFEINGAAPAFIKRENNSLRYAVPPEAMKPGRNEVTLEVDGAKLAGKPARAHVIMKGDAILGGTNYRPWRRLYHAAKDEAIVDGAYVLKDTRTGPAGKIALFYPLNIKPGRYFNVGFDLKVVAGSDPLCNAIRLADGEFVEIVTFSPGEIGFQYAGSKVKFDTADDFHAYVASMGGGFLTLAADGREIARVPLRQKADDPKAKLDDVTADHWFWVRSDELSLLFGSLSGPGTGEGRWRNVRLIGEGDTAEILDFKIDLAYQDPSAGKGHFAKDPEWAVDFNVENGELPGGLAGKRYHPADASIVESGNEKVLRLNHRRQGVFELAAPAWNDPDNRIFITEFKLRYGEDRDGKGSFSMVTAPVRKNDKRLGGAFYIYEQKVYTPWGTVKLPHTIRNRDAVFRIVLDSQSGTASIALDGKVFSTGKVPERTFSGLSFGDGSKLIEGQVDLVYFKAAALP